MDSLGHATKAGERAKGSQKPTRRQVKHCAGCDCVFCSYGDIIVQFPAPPERPRHRPDDMSRDFDDMEIIPDKTEMERKKRRKEAAEADEIRETMEWYNIQAERWRKTGEPIDMSQRQYDILYVQHPLFRKDHSLDATSAAPTGFGLRTSHVADKAYHTLGLNAHLSGGPVARKPQVVNRNTFGSIASSRPVMVNGLNQHDDGDASVHNSYDGNAVRSLNPHGRRNLQGFPAVSKLSDAPSSRRRHKDRGLEFGAPAAYSSSASTPANYLRLNQGFVANAQYPSLKSSFTASVIRSRARGHVPGSQSISGHVTTAPSVPAHRGGHARSASANEVAATAPRAAIPAYKAKAPSPIVPPMLVNRKVQPVQSIPVVTRGKVEVDSTGRVKRAVPVPAPKASSHAPYGRF